MLVLVVMGAEGLEKRDREGLGTDLGHALEVEVFPVGLGGTVGGGERVVVFVELFDFVGDVSGHGCGRLYCWFF